MARTVAVKPLGFPDRHHVNSALGWLELGNPQEARAEAERISMFGRAHHEAFLVRWRIAARVGLWEEALRFSAVFTKICPGQVVGWICRSYSLYRLRRPLEAWMILLPKTSEFPTVSALPYILACYASELGNHRVAKQFLTRSAALGGPSAIHGTSLQAEQLEELTIDLPTLSPRPLATPQAPPAL